MLFIAVCFTYISVQLAEAQINWNGNNWAFACDFKNNDLTNAKSTGSECGQKCYNTQSCTHFTWTSYNGGTCWMKSGSVSKADAVLTGDEGMICGVLDSSIASPSPAQSNLLFYYS